MSVHEPEREIEVLREVLRRIAAHGYGLQNIADDHEHDVNAYNYHAMKYWSARCQNLQSIAREAVTQSEERMASHLGDPS